MKRAHAMTLQTQFRIEWIDAGREPREKPDPDYPLGIDLDMAKGRLPACKAIVPYPAKRCGYWHVECNICGESILITTAGRVDDPRSITMPCKPIVKGGGHAH